MELFYCANRSTENSVWEYYRKRSRAFPEPVESIKAYEYRHKHRSCDYDDGADTRRLKSQTYLPVDDKNHTVTRGFVHSLSIVICG